MKLYLKVISAGLLVSAACTVAIAQTSDSTTKRPTPIGTSQETADKANAEAIKRGDTATVVRTGPSAADKASSATSTVKDKVGNAVDSAKDTASDAAKDTKHNANKMTAPAKSDSTTGTTTTRP
jgi:hypothetical protein